MAKKPKGLGGGTIVKKYEIVEGGHHGGAWKVAYADFVTAMMAFFLLMWLLNATTEEQRKGLADYFSPSNVMAHNNSGSGAPFGGHTPFDKGSLASDRGAVQVLQGSRPVVEFTREGEDPVNQDAHRARSGDGMGTGRVADDQDADDKADDQGLGEPASNKVAGPGGGADMQRDGLKFAGSAEEAAAMARGKQEAARFEQAAQQIKDAVRNDPALSDLAKQLAIDMTPEGLRIQIMDEIKLPMFASGSVAPNERARLLIQKVVPILNRLNAPLSIAGHTDAQPFTGQGRSNWELSAERANATRRLLVEGGLTEARVRSVSGHADRDPLLPADPLAAANRRIAILVLREAAAARVAP
jgi:chemotaxis protein MotB